MRLDKWLWAARFFKTRARRAAQVADRRAHATVWAGRKGRPTKRDRREMERWRRNRKDEG